MCWKCVPINAYCVTDVVHALELITVTFLRVQAQVCS